MDKYTAIFIVLVLFILAIVVAGERRYAVDKDKCEVYRDVWTRDLPVDCLHYFSRH